MTCMACVLPYSVVLAQHEPTCSRFGSRPTLADYKALTEKLQNEKLLPTCVTCVHFNDEYEMCKLAGMRPPAKIIARGCPSWEDDGVPF